MDETSGVWSNPYRRRWVLGGILAMTFLLVNVYRPSTAVISGRLMDALGTTGAQLGTLHAVFFVVYALMQIPTGILVDRVGPPRTATAGATVMNRWALDAYWTGEYIDGVRVYTETGYRVAFGIATLAGVLAVGCAVWLHRHDGER